MHLVQLVAARKEGVQRGDFEHHAPRAPDIHLAVIVAVSHEALRGAIPPWLKQGKNLVEMYSV